MYLIKTPGFIQSLFPNFIWKIPTNDKVVYITFDDGPIPEVTPWVLEQMNNFNAKATFFCVGDNIEKHPEVLELVKNDGHDLGNHTFNHLNGWATENLPYFHNVRKCANLVKSEFFRPPYGKIRPSQVQFLQRHYKIIMWDVLSADFDNEISKQQCLNNVLENVKPGSIVVFHDSLKAWKNLKYVLPNILDILTAEGYQFKTLSSAFETVESRELITSVV